MSRSSFLKGAAILALAGVAVRLIGALYRIPLTQIIGVEGVGLYQMAYPVYGLLLTLSTAGIPGAISKMVSERLVHSDERNARRIFHISLLLLSVVGLMSGLAMAAGHASIALWIGGKGGAKAAPSMLAAAPSLFLVAVITAYRGYFQGLQHMTPTALSQVWEQVVKIIPGFFIAAHLNRYGPEYGAAGAMWGVALSELVALLYLMVTYVAYRHKQQRDGRLEAERRSSIPPIPFRLVVRRLVKLALPMVAGAVFLPLASLADAFIVLNRLADLGYPDKTAQALYGILSGMVNVLVNVPSVLSLSLSTSIIPAIAESCELKNPASVRRKSTACLKMTMLVALPSAVGLAVLAKPILDLLYGPALSPAQLDVGTGLLLSSAVSVVFLSTVQSTNGILQGLGRVTVPMVSLAVGAAVKIGLNYILVGIPSVNIHGAPLGTIVCYLIPTAINLWFVRKAAGVRLEPMEQLIRPGLASALMGAAAWSLHWGLAFLMGGKLATVVTVLLAIPVYLVCSVLVGSIGRDELSFLPKGAGVASLLGRFNLLRE